MEDEIDPVITVESVDVDAVDRLILFMEESALFTFPYQTYGNHAMEPSTVSHIISQQHWGSTFNFTEIVSKYF